MNRINVKRAFPLVLGLSLCEMVIFHGYLTSFLYASSTSGYMGKASISIIGIAFYALTSGVLVVLARTRRLTIPPYLPAAILAMGYVVGFFLKFSTEPMLVAQILLSVSYGVGGVLFRAQWLETLTSHNSFPPRQITLLYIVSVFLGLTFSLVLAHAPFGVAFIFLSISPLASAHLARYFRKSFPTAPLSANLIEGKPAFTNAVKIILGPAIGVAVLEGIIGVLNISVFSEENLSLFAENSVWIIRLLALLFFFIILIAVPQRFNPISLFKASFPFTIAGLLLLALFGSLQGSLTSSILLIGYNLVYLACMLLVVETTYTNQTQPYIATGLFGLVTSGFLLVGFALSFFLKEIREVAGVTELTLIGFSCVYLLSMTLLFFSFGNKQPHSLREETSLALFAKKYSFSPRETDTFRHLVKGHSAIHIAKSLKISEHTVWGYIKRIYSKTDVHSKQELINFFDKFCKQKNTH